MMKHNFLKYNSHMIATLESTSIDAAAFLLRYEKIARKVDVPF